MSVDFYRFHAHSEDGQVHQTHLIRNLTYSNPAFVEKLAAIQSGIAVHTGEFVAQEKANFMVYMQLQQQANLLAFMDCFKIYAAAVFLLTPFVFLFKKAKYKKEG